MAQWVNKYNSASVNNKKFYVCMQSSDLIWIGKNVTSNCAKQTVWERCGCVDLASLVSRLSSINECPSQSDHVNQNVGWSEIMSNPSFQNYIQLWQYLNLFISELKP